MCRSGPAADEKPDKTIWVPVTVAVPATCLSLAPAKVPVRVAAVDCDIAGAAVDCDIADVVCDIAGPELACFELPQAARAKAIVSTAAPFSAMDRI